MPQRRSFFILICLMILLHVQHAFADVTYDLDDLVGFYDTKVLYFDQSDKSYGYNAERIQWMTFDSTMKVTGFNFEYSGKIEQYPTYIGTSTGFYAKPRVSNFMGVNFNNSPPPAWSGTWSLGSWNPHDISNEYEERSLSISSDGSFTYKRKLDYSALGSTNQYDEVGVYLDFFFDYNYANDADIPGTINVTNAKITIIGTDVSIPDDPKDDPQTPDPDDPTTDPDDDDSDTPTIPTTLGEIYPLSPSPGETYGFGSTGGKITFSFSKILGASKYVLHLELNDILNQLTFPIFVELVPAGNGSNGTTGFSDSFVGMVYDLTIDLTTWEVLSAYDIKWGVEAYDDKGILIGSTFENYAATKYVNSLKFLASYSITLTSPSLGDVLSKSDSAPSFSWELYQGVNDYTLILAHSGSLGFDDIIIKDGLKLNLVPIEDSTWQSMTTGTWYWTVLGYSLQGDQTPGDFTIFDFEVE